MHFDINGTWLPVLEAFSFLPWSISVASMAPTWQWCTPLAKHCIYWMWSPNSIFSTSFFIAQILFLQNYFRRFLDTADYPLFGGHVLYDLFRVGIWFRDIGKGNMIKRYFNFWWKNPNIFIQFICIFEGSRMAGFWPLPPSHFVRFWNSCSW